MPNFTPNLPLYKNMGIQIRFLLTIWKVEDKINFSSWPSIFHSPEIFQFCNDTVQLILYDSNLNSPTSVIFQ